MPNHTFKDNHCEALLCQHFTSLPEGVALGIPCAKVTLLSTVALLGSSRGVIALLRLLACSSSEATPWLLPGDRFA